MSDERKTRLSQDEADLEREILEGRKFTLEEAIARMVGPGAMKGQSPVPAMRQAEFEIESWMAGHLCDASGALRNVLLRQVKGSELLLNNYEQPLVVLAGCCQRILDSDYLLEELVRDADVQWGRVVDERPHFEAKGAPRHPDDPYTIDSVRLTLLELLEKLAAAEHAIRRPMV